MLVWVVLIIINILFEIRNLLFKIIVGCFKKKGKINFESMILYYSKSEVFMVFKYIKVLNDLFSVLLVLILMLVYVFG